MTCSRRKLLIVAATKLPLGPLISYRHEQTLGFVLRAHKIIKDQPCYIHNKTGMNQSSSPILFVFGAKEEIPAPEIHQRLQRAYGSVCMGASSVRRWVKYFKDGKTEAIQKAVRQCLRMAGTEFYRRRIFKFPERWKKCVQRSGDYVEKIKKVV